MPHPEEVSFGPRKGNGPLWFVRLFIIHICGGFPVVTSTRVSPVPTIYRRARWVNREPRARGTAFIGVGKRTSPLVFDDAKTSVEKERIGRSGLVGGEAARTK